MQFKPVRMEKLEMTFKRLGYEPSNGRIALMSVKTVLDEKENVKVLIESVYSATVGLLIATDMRVFYLGDNLLNRTVFQNLQYKDIEQIDFKMGKLPFTGTLEIKTSKRIMPFKACVRERSEDFIRHVNEFKS